MHLKIQPLSPEVSALYKSHGSYHPGDSGLDLYIAEEKEIAPGGTEFIKLGIKASGWNGDKNVSFLVFPRSSISKTPLRLANSVGVIDSGYRGELMGVFDNRSNCPYRVSVGDRLLQAVSFTGEEVTFELVDKLDETARGEGGFGSTTAKTVANGRQ